MRMSALDAMTLRVELDWIRTWYVPGGSPDGTVTEQKPRFSTRNSRF